MDVKRQKEMEQNQRRKLQRKYGNSRTQVQNAIKEWRASLRGVLRVYNDHGKAIFEVEMRQERYDELLASSLTNPLLWETANGISYWEFQGRIYTSRQELDANDVLALVQAQDLRKKQKIARARAVGAVGVKGKLGRTAIPDDIKIFIWQRDEGRCTRCNSNKNLEFDHIIPLSMCGANTARNLQLLCEPCNRAKGGNLV